MRDLELLDILAIISLLYQADSNEQLRNQSTNDDILREIKEIASTIEKQNDEMIALMKGILEK